MTAMTIGKAFKPELGKCYDLRYGRVQWDGQNALRAARIRVKGFSPADWEDIDTGQPLDARLRSCRVQSYKEIAIH